MMVVAPFVVIFAIYCYIWFYYGFRLITLLYGLVVAFTKFNIFCICVFLIVLDYTSACNWATYKIWFNICICIRFKFLLIYWFKMCSTNLMICCYSSLFVTVHIASASLFSYLQCLDITAFYVVYNVYMWIVSAVFTFWPYKNRGDGLIVNKSVIHQKPRNEQLKFYKSPHGFNNEQNPYHKASCKRPQK